MGQLLSFWTIHGRQETSLLPLISVSNGLASWQDPAHSLLVLRFRDTDTVLHLAFYLIMNVAVGGCVFFIALAP